MLDALFESLDQNQIDYELNRRGYQIHPSGLFDPDLGTYLSDEESENILSDIVRSYDTELSIF